LTVESLLVRFEANLEQITFFHGNTFYLSRIRRSTSGEWINAARWRTMLVKEERDVNGTRVVEEGRGNRPADDAGPDSSAAPGAATITERVLGTHGFRTARGDSGHIILLVGPQGLVMVQRSQLPDGSVLEWTRALRTPDALLRGLRGLTLTGDSDAAQRKIARLAN
jgi:hypothetical protein